MYCLDKDMDLSVSFKDIAIGEILGMSVNFYILAYMNSPHLFLLFRH